MTHERGSGPSTGIGTRFFDLWSRVYDIPLVQRLAYRPVHDAVVRNLAHQPVGRIIDVGCGTGLLTSRLHWELAAAMTGLDFSRGMLERAHERDPTIPWIQGNAMALPFGDGTFDALTCTESFHWYPDQRTALLEFQRVLRPHGTALIAFINPPVSSMSRMTAPGTPLGRTAHYPTAAEMARMVSNAGLDLVDQRRVWRLPGGPLLAATLTIARHP